MDALKRSSRRRRGRRADEPVVGAEPAVSLTAEDLDEARRDDRLREFAREADDAFNRAEREGRVDR